MIAGMLRPDTGTVAINGGNPTLAGTRRLLGIAPQSLALYEDLTATENLRFFGQLYGISGSELNSRVEWALSLSGLNDRAKDRVRTFSGGMKRRLNIAVGMIHQPKILLLDEPTVGVDPQSRNHILETIRGLVAEGLTIIYTTHYMEEAQKLCDRVAIMDQGKLLAADSVHGLLTKFGGDSVIHMRLAEDSQPLQHDGLQPDGSYRIVSSKPIAELTHLQSSGMKFQEVQIAQPDLESVFLSLTGRSLRD
jgi:ABC-2 type transport system ATP-binding protein